MSHVRYQASTWWTVAHTPDSEHLWDKRQDTTYVLHVFNIVEPTILVISFLNLILRAVHATYDFASLNYIPRTEECRVRHVMFQPCKEWVYSCTDEGYPYFRMCGHAHRRVLSGGEFSLIYELHIESFI